MDRQRYGLLLVLILVVGIVPLSGAAVEVDLRAGLPSISHPRAAPLSATDFADASRDDLDLRLESDPSHHWVFSPGDPVRLRAAAESPEKGDRALLTVWDWQNQPVRQIAWKVPFSEELRFRVTGRGTWLLTLDRLRGLRTVSRLARSFSVCPSNEDRVRSWNVDRFFIGVCSFPSRQHWRCEYGTVHLPDMSPRESAELDADLTARLGIQVVRFDAGHGDENDWIARMYERRGLHLFLKISRPRGDVMEKYRGVTDPKWRYPHPESSVRPHFRHLAEQYGRRALFFELYNEPDTEDFWRGTPEEYVERMRWLREEFRASATNAVLAAGGYTQAMPDRFRFFVRELKGLVDWITYHTHGDLPRCVDRWNELRRAHEDAGYTHPVYVNSEMGSAAWRLDQEMPQAYVAMQKILYFWVHGNRGVVLFDSRSIQGVRVGKNRPGRADWGYLDHFFCPRFKYGALASLIEHFDGMVHARALEDGPHRYVFEFDDGKDRKIVTAFRPRREPSAPGVVLLSDADSALLIDPMGNSLAVVDPTRVFLKVDRYPSILLLRGARQIRMITAQE